MVPMRDWLIKDFHWKAFSLLMAVGIWLTVRKISEEPEVQLARVPGQRNTYEVTVLAVSANADVHDAQLVPRSVDVTVSGPAAIMNNLQAGRILAVVNLTGIASAQDLPRTVEVSAPDATVVDVQPPQVSVTLPKKP